MQQPHAREDRRRAHHRRTHGAELRSRRLRLGETARNRIGLLGARELRLRARKRHNGRLHRLGPRAAWERRAGVARRANVRGQHAVGRECIDLGHHSVLRSVDKRGEIAQCDPPKHLGQLRHAVAAVPLKTRVHQCSSVVLRIHRRVRLCGGSKRHRTLDAPVRRGKRIVRGTLADILVPLHLRDLLQQLVRRHTPVCEQAHKHEPLVRIDLER